MHIFTMRKIDIDLWIKRGTLVLYDMCAVAVSIYGAILLRYDLVFRQIDPNYISNIRETLPFLIIGTVIIFCMFRLYSSLWTYAGVTELLNIIMACILAGGYSIFIFYLADGYNIYAIPRSCYISYATLLTACVVASRYAYRGFRFIVTKRVSKAKYKRTLIVGAGAAGNTLIKEIRNSEYLNKKVVGIIDDDKSKVGNYLHGIRVLGTRDDIVPLAQKKDIDEIIVAMPSASAKELREILDICKQTRCELKRLPGIYQLVNGEVSIGKLRNVDVNDLLGREAVEVDLSSILAYVSGNVVLVTGGGGSIGSELCRQIAAHNPKQLVVIDIYENSTYEIQNELKRMYPELNLKVLIASVRNTKRVDLIFGKYRPDIVYHAAAHKHVPLMEDSPNEAVKNNVLGTWKVVQAADKWHVRKFIMISTDKAVNPTNIMGATKRLCEMIVQTYDRHSGTEFVAVRFGNVLGSNGSVIPLFKRQIEEGGPVTVTHPDIVRYFMTIPEAVSLVLQAGAYAKGGEIFVLDMGKPVKIVDLAKNLILLSGHEPDGDIKIVYTGLRPGEKLYEEMLMDEEGLQKTENKMIYIGKPIELDEKKFMEQLEALKEYVVEEPEDIRVKVQELVPTYQIES